MFGKKLLRELYPVLPLLTLIFLLIGFNGCENSTESNSSQVQVKGRISGMFGLPLPGVTVKAKSSSTSTDIYGRFDLGNIEAPFSLALLDTFWNKCLYIPDRGSNNTGGLYVNYVSDPPGYVTSLINISYPLSVFQNCSGKSMFTDFHDRNFPGDVTSNGSTITVHMVPGTSYEGSVAVLAYAVDNNMRITSYEKYCLKNGIVLNAGDNINVNLTSDDFKTNSVNNTYHVSINAGTGQNVNIRYAYLTFGSRQSPNYVLNVTQEFINSDVSDIVVPGGFNVANNVIMGYTSLSSVQNEGQTKMYFPVKGDVTVNSPQIPVLVSPLENAVINANTEFVFNSGLNHVENKFYKLILSEFQGTVSKYSIYEIFLDKEKFNLSELNNLGIPSLNGRIFDWNVEVYENISLEDYLSESGNNFKYSAISGNRRFSVNP